MKKILTLALIATAAVSVLAAPKAKITVKGSDTMVILAQRWAEKYMTAHPDVTIQVTGGGSGTGISALVNGSTDICNASRPMKGSERAKLNERYASNGVEIKAAKDGITVYAHPSNTVKDLTLAQLAQIYTGKITNWKQVGGADAKIVVYGRENSSGTYTYFLDFVLKGKDYVASMQSLPGTAAVVNAVSKDKYAIGYGGAAYAKGVREVPVKKDAATPAYLPEAKTIANGTYPISRYLYLYTVNKPTGAIKAFIDWILSAEGQAMATQVGYFPAR